MAKRSLLITADDYGVFDPIDKGIEYCIDKIDCIDVIVTHTSSERRIQHLVRTYKERIDKGTLKIGLHLTLTVGGPLNTADKLYYRKLTQKPIIGPRRFKRDSAATFIMYLNNIIDIPACRTGIENELIAQYQAFKRFTEMEPYHISSHEGVYSGHPVTYEMLREFCNRKNIIMRCPTFINFALNEQFDEWRDNEQRMLPKIKLAGLLALEEGRVINRWMQHELEKKFRSHLATGAVQSTDYFIEHFFEQGSSAHLKALLKRVAATPGNQDLSFEMVVHPVMFHQKSELRKVPNGIKASIMEKRKREAQALNHINVRKRMKLLKIISVINQT